MRGRTGGGSARVRTSRSSGVGHQCAQVTLRGWLLRRYRAGAGDCRCASIAIGASPLHQPRRGSHASASPLLWAAGWLGFAVARCVRGRGSLLGASRVSASRHRVLRLSLRLRVGGRVCRSPGDCPAGTANGPWFRREPGAVGDVKLSGLGEDDDPALRLFAFALAVHARDRGDGVVDDLAFERGHGVQAGAFA